MFLFQEIPSFQIGFGFAVELFVLIFSFLCWLISASPKVASTDINSAQRLTGHYFQYCDYIVDELTMKEARKVLIKLQELEMINPDMQLTGKGVTKKLLITLIKREINQSKKAVASVLEEIFGQTV